MHIELALHGRQGLLALAFLHFIPLPQRSVESTSVRGCSAAGTLGYCLFLGMSSHTPTGNDWLQHFELVSIVPAFVVGYLVSRRFGRLATYAWILPTLIFTYELLKFTEPQVSVLAPHSSTRFQYFFVIQRTMPTFTPGFGEIDPVRVALQTSAVAPFYAGLAYTAGALAAKHDLLKRIFGSSPMQPEPKMTQTEKRAEGSVADESEKAVHELD